MKKQGRQLQEYPISLAVDSTNLEGSLVVPASARGLVIIAPDFKDKDAAWGGQYIARRLQGYELATLHLVLTAVSDGFRIDDGLPLLKKCLASVSRWAATFKPLQGLRIGLFGSGVAAAACLELAVRQASRARALVLQSGQVNLTEDQVSDLSAPCLLIVGQKDRERLAMNRRVLQSLTGPKELLIIPEAHRLFKEIGSLDVVAAAAARWFCLYLAHKTVQAKFVV